MNFSLKELFVRFRIRPLAIAMVLWASCQSNLPDDIKHAYQNLPDEVDFNFHIRPILSDRCYKCHGPDEGTREAEFRLDLEEQAFAPLNSDDEYAFVAHSTSKSLAWSRVVSDDPDFQMPPPTSNLKLSAHEKALLTKWIEQGAQWKEHWSFTPPTKSSLPKISDLNWPINPIDHFVLKALDDRGYVPAPQEAKSKLIRRLSFDLRGLPPSIEEIDAFIDNDGKAAYQDLVDRMLSSSAYGERMATEWLDLARYGDTQGYHHDLERNMWPWRDWVIEAFNKNQPYDEFVRWQLAGDLLPEPTYDQKLATAFNRNHKMTQECGVIDEEFRIEYVIDRTNTMGTAFLGMTIACAQCHDHKYDPISQENYYEMFAFFNQVPEKGKWQSFQGSSPPYLSIPAEQQEQIKSYIDQLVTQEYENGSFQDGAQTYRWVWEEELNQLLQPTMVMADMDTVRKTYILNRGIYSDRGKQVQASTPGTLLPFSDQYPRNRLGLANWLFEDDHPLTARVAVNRLWQMIFGRGLVSTPEDFGSQGALPSHPELLDWLAVEFQENGWDIKKILKLMLTSATYQQSANIDTRALEEDPENIWLARGPQARLTAEMIRDNALSISGLLVEKLGGPSVKPYQPDGLWVEVSSGGRYQRKYMQSHGQDLYRRSMYTFWKRMQPPPAMMVFDAASRNNCTIKRQSTSTPLQAMVLLNDPQFIEASRALAIKMINDGGQNIKDQIIFGFRSATSRFPDDEELEILQHLFEDEIKEFSENNDRADQFLENGEMVIDDHVDPIEVAALTVVANTLLNLAECIHKS